MKKKIQFVGLSESIELPPENTLESIQLALDEGAPIIEVDLHLCDSGELVVIHDADVDMSTNGMGDVDDFTLEELQKLKIAGKYKIPSLAQVLDLIDGKAKLHLELRGFGTSEAVVKIINSYCKKEQWKRKMFLVTSFNWFELFDFYGINQKIRIGVLTQKLNKDAMEMAKNVNAYSIHPKDGSVKGKMAKKAKKKGYKILPWHPEFKAALDEVLEGYLDDDFEDDFEDHLDTSLEQEIVSDLDPADDEEFVVVKPKGRPNLEAGVSKVAGGV
jgi:glycerophosphoryl diester phosphodiesterase